MTKIAQTPSNNSYQLNHMMLNLSFQMQSYCFTLFSVGQLFASFNILRSLNARNTEMFDSSCLSMTSSIENIITTASKMFHVSLKYKCGVNPMIFKAISMMNIIVNTLFAFSKRRVRRRSTGYSSNDIDAVFSRMQNVIKTSKNGSVTIFLIKFWKPIHCGGQQ